MTEPSMGEERVQDDQIAALAVEVRRDSKRWSVKRAAGREVYVSPEGREYVRTDEARAVVRVEFSGKYALAPLYLRPESSERLVEAQGRKLRRAERREEKRLARKRGSLVEAVAE